MSYSSTDLPVPSTGPDVEAALTLTKDVLNECCVSAHTCICFLPLQKERVGQMPLRIPAEGFFPARASSEPEGTPVELSEA